MTGRPDLPRRLVAEGLGTFCLVFAGTGAVAVNSVAGDPLGGTIALEALAMGPITGASMNPARSLAPAAVAGDFADLWIHMAGPVLGALGGVAIYAFLRDARDSTVAAVPMALTENQEAAR